ncbi:MAG: gtcA [Clostridia bacterium]|nr:gtcA [Clostridia bacterium]
MIKSLYSQYKQIIRYIIFGIMSTIINYSCYFLFTRVLDIYYVTSNLISWIVTISFAFIMNKLFVFFSMNWHLKKVVAEFILFVAGRTTSLLVEVVILYTTVEICFINDIIAKLTAYTVVILLNYFISKLLIFKN